MYEAAFKKRLNYKFFEKFLRVTQSNVAPAETTRQSNCNNVTKYCENTLNYWVKCDCKI